MSEIGSGSGTSYPSSLDTDATIESTSTKVRKEWANDVTSAIVAMQNEMGTNPSGSVADVATRIAAQHHTNGNHLTIYGVLPSYTEANLPTDGSVGIARVTDGIRGVWRWNGTAWHSLTGHADVRDFGAVGDGVTNDTAAWSAWQAALDATDDGTGFIPDGIYLIDSWTVTSRAKRYLASSAGSVGLTTGVQIRCRSAITNFVTVSGVGHQFKNLYINGSNLATNVVRYTNTLTDVVMDEVTISGAVNGGTNLNLTPITADTQVAEIKFYGVVLAGRSGGANITNLKIDSDQSLVISFYNLKSFGNTTDVDYGVDLQGGDVAFYTPFFTNNTINDLRLAGGNVTIVHGRSESAIDSISASGGSGKVVLENYIHGASTAVTTYTQTSGFTGSGTLIGGNYTNLINSSTSGMVLINATLYPGGAITGTLPDKVLRVPSTSLRLHGGGTLLVAGDIALSAGWGSTASVSSIAGTDQRTRFTITSAGSGQGANPTATLTFTDGTWTTAPFAVVSRNGGDQASVLPTWTTTATTLVITFPGTPSAGQTFSFEALVMG